MLIKLISILTRTDRYQVEPVYGNLWTYNYFRLYEYIFGRRFGIKAETSIVAQLYEGRTTVIYQYHSWESAFVHLERWIRGLIPRTIPIKIWVPQLSTPAGLPNINAGYVFAIALDASSGNRTASATTLTYASTVTGSNVLGLCGASVAETANSNLITGVTWNSSSMTLYDAQADAFTDYINMFYIYAPTTGNVVVTRSSSGTIEACMVTYSGCKQSGFPDAGGKQATTSSTITQTVTTVTDQCWMAGVMMVHRGQTMGANTTERAGSGINTYYVDSNGARSTGSNSLTTTQSDSTGSSQVYAAFAPYSAPPATNSGFLMFM